MSTEDAPLPAAPRITGGSPHLLIVRAPYYKAVIDGLTQGAQRILGEAGATSEILDIAGHSTAMWRLAASCGGRRIITISSVTPRCTA